MRFRELGRCGHELAAMLTVFSDSNELVYKVSTMPKYSSKSFKFTSKFQVFAASK